MNILKKTLFLFIFLIPQVTALPQESLSKKIPAPEYHKAIELFNREKYGAALEFFKIITSDPNYENSLYQSNAWYYLAVSSIRLFNEDADYLTTKFISLYPENPHTNDAIYEMALMYFNREKYPSAIEWFEKTDINELSREKINEYYFKSGYSWFILDSLDKARLAFYEIKDIDNPYAAPAIYYYSHITYTQEKYETALEGFKRLEGDETFGPIVPYYISQILYLQEKFNEVIEYAPPLLETVSEKRKAEMSRIVGDAYYKTGQYEKALPFLETYRDKSSSMTPADKYQLGFTYYQTMDYQSAAALFESITGKNNSLSQNALYHLADCYLKTGDKKKARLAFSSASQMDFNAEIREDALFNYAKLTYELSYNPFNDAIRALNEYIEKYPHSKRTDEAYNYLVMAYLNTRNYRAALESINKIRNKNEKIKQAYQKVAFYRGLELFNNLAFHEAIDKFDISLEHGTHDPGIRARTLYWKGETWYRLQSFDDALENYKLFLYSPGARAQPEYNIAHYNTGYVYYKKKEYDEALSWFNRYVNLMGNAPSLTVADAQNRIADCYFVQTRYADALKAYDKAIANKTADNDYPMFQKAFTLGLMNKHAEKINILSTLLKEKPDSPYTDDALYETGKSYIALNKPDQAEKYYLKIIDEYDNSSYLKKSLVQLGLLNYNKQNNQKAMAYYKRAVEEYPGTEEARNGLRGIKNIYIDLNEPDGYFKYVNTLGTYANVSMTEQDSVFYTAGEKMYLEGNCEGAVSTFEKYIDKFQEGNFILNAHFYKADCQYRMKEFEDALVSYNFVISKPRNIFTEQSLLSAAKINFSEKDFKNAAQNYRQLINVAEVRESMVEARVGLMRSLYRSNEYGMTIEAASNLLAMDKLEEQLIREARFIIAKSYFELEDYKKALGYFEKVATEVTSIEGAESKYRVAEIYYMQKEYNRAEAEIFDFVDKNTPHAYWMAKGFLLLTDVYIALEDYFQATHTLQSIIDYYENPGDGIIEKAKEKKKQVELMQDNNTPDEEVEEISLPGNDEN